MLARFESIIIGLPEITDSEDMIPLEEVPKLNTEGWDDLTITYATKRASLTAEELAAEFPLGTRLGTRNWWVVASAPKQIAPGFWTAEVAFKGWASEKPAKISAGASADSQSAQNISTPDGLMAKVTVVESTPTMRVSYLVDDYTLAPTILVGREATPPDALAVADSVWDYLTEYTYNWPYGWVLMASAPDRLPGCTAALVSDDYKYIRNITP